MLEVTSPLYLCCPLMHRKFVILMESNLVSHKDIIAKDSVMVLPQGFR